MRCGARCFQVETEIDGEKQIKSIKARTPAEARKTIRKEYGAKTPVISVRERKSNS